nr:immunoglobulin heavy chain junction region [Macaca mulatta]
CARAPRNGGSWRGFFDFW